MTKGASSRRGAQNRTNGATTGRTSKAKRVARTDWSKLRRLSDAQIRSGIASDPDVRATDEAFWKDAKVVWPTPKRIVTMRLDADLLAWFRQQRGYQTRINAILRAYMKAHESEEST
jgi:uncharacterized protein (DUF4415 family)